MVIVGQAPSRVAASGTMLSLESDRYGFPLDGLSAAEASSRAVSRHFRDMCWSRVACLSARQVVVCTFPLALIDFVQSQYVFDWGLGSSCSF